MQFTATKSQILPALQKVAGVIDRRNSLPILTNVLIEAKEGRISLTGTDLETEVKTNFAAEIEIEGDITIPAKKLLDIVKNLADDATIRLKLNDERCTITSGRGRYSVGTLPAADYPTMKPEGEQMAIELPASQLKRLLDKTAFAMAQQDVRYYLNGMLLELRPNELISVATDGHRMARYITPIQYDALEGEPRQLIVPQKAVAELRRIVGNGDDTISIHMTDRAIQFSIDGTILTSKLIDGRYPEYERVIPTQSPRTATVEKDVLKRALSRTAILSNEKYRGVHFAISAGTLKLQAHNAEQEEAEEEIELEYDGEQISIGFNVAYLLDALSAIDDEAVIFQFNDMNGSTVWRGSNSEAETFVVMPMRL